MNIYAWEKSSRLATRTVMRNEKKKKIKNSIVSFFAAVAVDFIVIFFSSHSNLW